MRRGIGWPPDWHRQQGRWVSVPRPSARTITLWVAVVTVAVGVSLRPRALAFSDLFGRDSADDTRTLVGSSPLAHSAPDTPVAPPAPADRAPPSQPSAHTSSTATTVSWDVLATLNYRSGTVGDALLDVEGTRVRVPGFVVPLDDWQEEVTEFLLVPYFGACVHTPPPPPNQLVFVKLRAGRHKVSMWDPVWVEGVLQIETYNSPYGAVGFQMTANSVTLYEE